MVEIHTHQKHIGRGLHAIIKRDACQHYKNGLPKKHLIPEQWYDYPGVSNETLNMLNISHESPQKITATKRMTNARAHFPSWINYITLPPFTFFPFVTLSRQSKFFAYQAQSKPDILHCLCQGDFVNTHALFAHRLPSISSCPGVIHNKPIFLFQWCQWNYEQNQECFWRNKSHKTDKK